MAERELESLFSASLQGLREMIDVNTIIGEPIMTNDGSTIIPVSKVSFGFGMGGTDIAKDFEVMKNKNIFGGGSGGGVTIQPVAFLIVSNGDVRMLSIDATSPFDKVIEAMPDLIKSASTFFQKNKD